MSNAVLEIIKISISFVAGLIVVWYWNYKKDELERYRFLDDSYNKILNRYFENAKYGDPDTAKNYAARLQGEELMQYHYFAMSVHNFLESIYDIFSGNIPTQWKNVYNYHSQLHASWLQNNTDSFMQCYVDSVLKEKH